MPSLIPYELGDGARGRFWSPGNRKMAPTRMMKVLPAALMMMMMILLGNVAGPL